VTVEIVRSSAAFAAQFKVAISSTATRVLPVVAPRTLEVSVGLVRYTSWFAVVADVVPETVAEALESLPYAVIDEVAAIPNTWLELEEAPPETNVAISPFKVTVFELFLGTMSGDVEPRLKTMSPVVAPVIVIFTGPASNTPVSSNNWRLLKEAMPAELLPPIVSLNVMSVTRTSSVLFAVSFNL
jgi:hypothetical protein